MKVKSWLRKRKQKGWKEIIKVRKILCDQKIKAEIKEKTEKKSLKNLQRSLIAKKFKIFLANKNQKANKKKTKKRKDCKKSDKIISKVKRIPENLRFESISRTKKDGKSEQKNRIGARENAAVEAHRPCVFHSHPPCLPQAGSARWTAQRRWRHDPRRASSLDEKASTAGEVGQKMFVGRRGRLRNGAGLQFQFQRLTVGRWMLRVSKWFRMRWGWRRGRRARPEG